MVYIQGHFATRLLLSQWRVVVLQERLRRTENEAEKLREAASRRASSIWNMKKDELIEKAMEDLGITRAQGESMTVVVLREKLRAKKAELNMQKDPLCVVPVGLEKMTRDQLAQECISRDLQLTVLNEGSEKVTRPKMIVAIREDVENRKRAAAAKAVPTSSPKPSQAPRKSKRMSDQDEDSEWEQY